MRVAAEMLRQGWSAKRVAFDLHYSGQDAFSRAFKMHFGLQPQCYRRPRRFGSFCQALHVERMRVRRIASKQWPGDLK